ncbi:MAG: SPFH domain-containing protein [Chloroflexota bacterium]|nr:SPFH domain-containing protein [Chloroflexota bacterium]
MPRIFDLIEYFDQTGREMVHRIPEDGSGDFRLGSQLIVRESQQAVFFRDGQALDTFGAGRHTLTTANLPVVSRLIGAAFGGRTPFRAEVYFVNMREFVDQKWGTPEAISLRDSELGMVRLRAFGTYNMQIADAQLFVNAIVGTQSLYNTSDIENFLRSILISRFTAILGEEQHSLFELPKIFDRLSASARAKARDDFQALGVDLRSLYITSISPTEETQKAIDERASMGAIGNMQAYMQFQAARALRDAAQASAGQGGGLTQAGMGLGAGMGMGGMMAGMMGQMMQPGGAAAKPTKLCPKCSQAIPADAKFCPSCGAKLEGGATCPNCKKEVAADTKFCPDCGTKLA